jgi:hypothetical protein
MVTLSILAIPMCLPRHVAILVLLLASPAGTSLATEHEAGTWLSFATSGGTQSGDSRWRYWLDGQARYVDIGSGASQYVLRPALGFQLNNRVTAWLGYARLETRTRSGLSAYENRYWQQVDWTAAQWGSASLTMRLRLEQRSVSTGDDLGLALRYRLRLTQPVGESSRYRLVFSLEPFLDLRDTDWRGSAGLNQNRLFAGITARVAERWRMETGYMNQYVAFENREDVSNHLFILRFIRTP